ncbi:MAG: cation-efflux pump, partial [Proteobacteria bacterium]|nr:cation-efflux pump [Pseudomonadota bacterium]
GLSGSLLGYRFLEPVAAINVGFMILRMGLKFTYEATRELVDTALSDEEVERIRTTLRNTSGVLGLHELRTRRMAHQVLADAHIQVDARISVSEGHRIAEMARKRVLAMHPEVLDVLVHVDAEEDTVPVLRGTDGELPERELLLEHLRSLLGVELPQLEKALLHYLGDRVEAEIFLPQEICFDPAQVLRMEQRLAEHLAGDPYFSAVSLNCRIAPKQGVLARNGTI